MRGSSSSGEMIRGFAREYRVSERTARNWRSAGDHRWVAWVEKWKVEKPADVPKAVALARDAERGAGELLTRLQDCARRERDPLQLEVLSKAIERARRTWEQARRDLKTVEAESGLLIPVSAVRKIQQDLVGQLGQIWRAWPNKIAGDLHPGLRPAFFEAVRKNARDWDKKIEEIDAALESLLC